MADKSSKRVKFDLGGDDQLSSGPIIEVDAITELTSRTSNHITPRESTQSALKVKPKYPYNPSKQKFDIRVDPEIRKRHNMACSYDECEQEAIGNCYMKVLCCSFGC